MSNLILPLSHDQAKSLAGKLWTFNGRTYYFKDYDPDAPGQPPWCSGMEAKAFPLLDAKGQIAAYLKFFKTPSRMRLERTLWLVAQQVHRWAPQLRAAPSAWIDSRRKGRPDGVEFDLTGCLATAAPGETWENLKIKSGLCKKPALLDKNLRWQCLRDLVAALARLEEAGIVHGDLSPGNILVNARPTSGGPALSVIDFDAFVAPTSGPHLVHTGSQGGTYGTPGYCPPDLVRKAEAGDTTVAPYSDLHSRDMLLLELLLAGPDFPPEVPPRDWHPDKLQLRYRALLATVPPEFTAAIAHLQPPAVFNFTESQRPSSTDLAKTLARQPPSNFAMVQKKDAGELCGTVPYGWDALSTGGYNAKGKEIRRLAPNEREQHWLREMARWRQAGLGWTAIATRLNRSGVPTKQGGGRPLNFQGRIVISSGQWQAGNVQSLLTSQRAMEFLNHPQQPRAVTSKPVNPPPTRSTRTLPGLGLELVGVEPGTFLMGSPASEAGRDSNEGPQTRVAISRGFSMGKYEVTQGQYAAVMGTNPSRFQRGMNLPVKDVSWVDATNFCAKLTEQERQAGRLPAGQVYRLPTEAEWEYACRAETTTRFSFGDDPQLAELGNYAWYGGNAGNQTHPVGTKAPNAWDLYDMHGNVWEWCLDWHGTYPGGSATDPQGPSSGSLRVIRGGSWGSDANYCRSAHRYYYDPTYRKNRIGFRVVLAPGQEKMPVALELVEIEPGTVLMGSPASDAGRDSNEGPQTRVTISRGFSMGKYEVTQCQYAAVMRTNPSRFKGSMNLPVENVSWVDATHFCAKLTEQERQAGRLPAGYVYRLPTEAEWEYACRAGMTTRFSFGDDPQLAELGKYAWYDGNAGNQTHPVGTKAPNAWGLYDMHGSVWEWCLDWYGPYPGGSATDPQGPSGGSFRVIRGGGWVNNAYCCRSAYRYYSYPTDWDSYFGFRVVLAPGQP